MAELDWTGEVRQGQKSYNVKRVQEWLVINGFNLVIDGIFGSVTEDELKEFQTANGLEPTGVVTADVFDMLSMRLKNCLTPTDPCSTLTETVAVVVKQHLLNRPVEVGGENRGPFVRHYMRGREGDRMHWCAGFVSTVVAQASAYHGVPSWLGYEDNCNNLAEVAEGSSALFDGNDPGDVPPGSIFLEKKGETGRYKHTGFVIERIGNKIVTIEGNFSGGRSQGVYKYKRSLSAVDIVKL